MSQLFDDLSKEQQQCAVDIAVAATILTNRIPSIGQDLYTMLCNHFSDSQGITANRSRYVLRHVGLSLYQQNWELTVSKRHSALVTKFVNLESTGGDGELGQSELTN